MRKIIINKISYALSDVCIVTSAPLASKIKQVGMWQTFAAHIKAIKTV